MLRKSRLGQKNGFLIKKNRVLKIGLNISANTIFVQIYYSKVVQKASF